MSLHCMGCLSFFKRTKSIYIFIHTKINRNNRRRIKRATTFEKSFSHSPPTPRRAWIPCAILKAPRGPVLIDVWRRSSTNFGNSPALSAIGQKLETSKVSFSDNSKLNSTHSTHVPLLLHHQIALSTTYPPHT